MSIINRVRKIQKSELLETCQLSSICFEYPYNPENKTEKDLLNQILSVPSSRGEKYWQDIWGAFTSENRLMSCLNVIPYTFQFDGNDVKAAGIGNVCTYPHYRRKGAVKSIFQAILPQMYDDGVMFSYLYPFSEAFYRKFGYERILNSINWNLETAALPCEKYDGSFSLLTDKSQLLKFEEAYASFASKYNLMVSREEIDWSNVTDAKAAKNNNYAYLYSDINNVPKGYVVFKRDMCDNIPTLNCRELIFDSFETLKAIFSFLSTYSSDYQMVRFYAPRTVNMEYFCPDFLESNSHMSIAVNGMVRVVNVEKVLAAARYRGNGKITLEITDPQIKENNGFFTVEYKDNSFISLEKNQRNDCDIKLPIHIFSTAIAGGYAPDDFLYLNDVTLHCSPEVLSSVFYIKPCWINNFF